MENELGIDQGLIDILSNAQVKSSYTGTKYFFEGDLRQKAEAMKASGVLKIIIEQDYGMPFVKSDEDFQKVIAYIVSNKINGWHHYVTNKK